MQDRIEKYNLTFPQENIWILEKLNPNTNMNNIFGIFRINKKLDVKILNEVMNKIIETNDVLRTRILEENNIPKQYISNIEHENFRTYILKDDTDNELNEIISKIAEERLPIENSKLYDIRIIQNNKTTCVCVKLHHIISDAWTLGQVAEQIKENYLKIYNKEEIEIKPSYKEYVKKDQKYRVSEKYLKDKEFWDDYVRKLNCENEFEIVKDKRSRRIQKSISLDLYYKISSFCEENKISEYVFFLGIISIYFSKIYNKENIVIGTPFLNRKRADKEMEMMGMFIATLPLNIKTQKEISFYNLCKNITSINMQCFKHSNYPYLEIQKAYQEYSKENVNLYEIAFSYQINKLEVAIEGDTGTTTWICNNTQSNPLLISYINHFGEHILCYDYMLNCFKKSDIEEMNERLLSIIEQVLKNKDILLENVDILSQNDRKLICRFNNTGNVKKSNETIISRFEKVAKENSKKVALVCGENKLTYLELEERANQIANIIQKKKIIKEAIPIILDNDLNFIISLLGVLKSGNYYVPILPEETDDRIKYILKDCKSRLVISNKKYKNKINLIDILEVEKIKAIEDNISVNANILPEDVAYLIYTSGTTGNPKGVMMKNENIISLINAMNLDEDLKYIDNDVAISLLKHSFDASAIDIYSSLLNGGKLVLVPKEYEYDPKVVVRMMKDEQVTRVFTVHKWIEQIQNQSVDNNIKLDKLRIIGTGAEVLQPKKFEKLLKYNPNINIYNTYGPTESTMFITKHKINTNDINKDYAPIGKLIPTTRAVVIDKNNTILPINVKGELAIYEDEWSAKNIAKGYLNQKELTAEKFINIKNNITESENYFYKTGDIVKINNELELEFMGRSDDFVKIAGGYLLSLNEVEHRIKDLVGESIELCVIVSKIKNLNNLILFIAKNSSNIKNDEIKNIIDDNITFYMKPKHIIEIDEIPRNKNGKIDRIKLEKIAKDYLKKKNTNIKPRTTLEQMIYDKVKKIVETDFSITDDFEEDLGLDSLNMTSLYVELKNSKMTIQDLYNYSTVKDLADMMKSEIINKEEKNQYTINIKNNSQQFNMENVLLTGVTGFVGVNLLNELVKNEETKKIYCIVRAKINFSSQERFENTIAEYFDDMTCEKIKKKVIVIDGDLTREDLGVSGEELKIIKSEVTTIINSAANVKHIGKYATFYKDNVETVLNLLNICKENNISFAHISTLSLYGFQNENTSGKIFDENSLNINQTFNKNPYLLSKYEAEKKILKEINNNKINAKIFRIGNIMPRISDGAFQKNYNQNAFMLAIKEIGDLGLKTVEIMNSEFYLTPVDECVKAINILLKSKSSNVIYHIESDKIVKVSDIVKIIKKKKGGELSIANTEELKQKLYEHYNVGVEHLNLIIEKNTNAYSKEETLKLLEKLNFKWKDINADYLNNIVKIAFKIK